MTHQHNVRVANIFADAKHACLVIKNYDSLTQRTSCDHFIQCKTCLPDNRNYDSPTEQTFCEHFMQCEIQHAQ